MKKFKNFWQELNLPIFEKSVALTNNELDEVDKKIKQLQARGLTSSKIIKALQDFNPKLAQEYRASAAYWTAVKTDDTKAIGTLGEDLGITKYKTILGPNACKICRNKTRDGTKIFKNSDIQKSGWGHVPPFHPNCFCIMIPIE